jgi:hypothetical protein
MPIVGFSASASYLKAAFMAEARASATDPEPEMTFGFAALDAAEAFEFRFESGFEFTF